MNYNFILVNADTDSISFCKSDQTEFTEEEQESLIAEINSLLPEKIKFENDGIFKKVICLKAKNYILYDGKKIKTKGSALKSSTLEPALKKFILEIVDSLLSDKDNQHLIDIYNKYIKIACSITDIRPWCSKKTITTKTLESERTNEDKIRKAIENTEYVEGDKIYVYFDEEENLKLVEHFDGKYNKDVFLKKLHNATSRFETILPVKELFLNYALKRNKNALNELLGIVNVN